MMNPTPQSIGTDLGSPLQRYDEDAAAQKFILMIGLGLVGVGLLALGYAAVGRWSAQAMLFIVAAATALLLYGLSFVYKWWRFRGMYVQVYSGGLLRVMRGKAEALRWDEISAVWQSVVRHYHNFSYAGTSTRFKLQTLDNRSMTLSDELMGITALGERIQSEVTRRLLPKALSAYQRHEDVSFGAFTVKTDAIVHGGTHIVWAQFERMKVDEGYIAFMDQGARLKWGRVKAAKIPNIFVFLALVDHIVGLKRGR